MHDGHSQFAGTLQHRDMGPGQHPSHPASTLLMKNSRSSACSRSESRNPGAPGRGPGGRAGYAEVGSDRVGAAPREGELLDHLARVRRDPCPVHGHQGLVGRPGSARGGQHGQGHGGHGGAPASPCLHGALPGSGGGSTAYDPQDPRRRRPAGSTCGIPRTTPPTSLRPQRPLLLACHASDPIDGVEHELEPDDEGHIEI